MPLILDQAKTQEQKQALDLALARLEFGRPFFMPPNVPAERVDAIRRAFDATMKDKEFLAEADKLKIEIDPLSGEQVAALIVTDLQDAGRDRRPRPRRDGAEITGRSRESSLPRRGRVDASVSERPGGDCACDESVPTRLALGYRLRASHPPRRWGGMMLHRATDVRAAA